MVRELSTEEIPELLELARMFFVEGKFDGELSEETFVSYWKKLIELRVGAVLSVQSGSEVIGMIGIIKFQCNFTGRTMAMEGFWYVKPQFRGHGLKLLRAFENWAKSNSVSKIWMSHLARLNGDRMAVLYDKLGFSLAEHLYAKEIKCVQ